MGARTGLDTAVVMGADDSGRGHQSSAVAAAACLQHASNSNTLLLSPFFLPSPLCSNTGANTPWDPDTQMGSS